MVVVGKTDQFEHLYTQKFRNFVAEFGHFVEYERDIATRDIGLHLTEPLPSGGAKLSTCLCWFQLKGIMASTLPKSEAIEAERFNYRLKVEHLKFWYLQPMPTYLGLYIESLNRFFILNLQKFVEETWGRDIFSLNQDTTEVEVLAGSVLDASALRIILRESTIEAWSRALSADENDIRLCQRDYKMIWKIGTAANRKVEQRFEIYDWQSKTRGEVHIQERPKGAKEWTVIRNHWQLGLKATDVEEMYPYLDFTPQDEGTERAEEYDEDGYLMYSPFGGYEDDYEPTLRLKNGLLAAGKDCAGEFHLYYILPELNELGRSLFCLIETLLKIKFIEIADSDEKGEFISIAPWHSRQV
jgi:hypothetical protein